MSERCGTVGQSFSPVLAPKRHWEVLLKEGMMAQKVCVRVWDPLTKVTLFPSWAQQQGEAGEPRITAACSAFWS